MSPPANLEPQRVPSAPELVSVPSEPVAPELPILSPAECHASSMTFLRALLHTHSSSLPRGQCVTAEGLTEFLLGEVYQVRTLLRTHTRRSGLARQHNAHVISFSFFYTYVLHISGSSYVQ